MKQSEVRRLRRAGWEVGSVKDFLGLSDWEMAYIDIRLALRHGLRNRRIRGGLSQTDLAAKIGSSQSRVAKMEAGDPTVSLDLLIRSLLALGASTKDVARALSAKPSTRSSTTASRARSRNAAA